MKGCGGEFSGLAMDRVYQELAPEARRLRLSCRSRALLPPADLLAFLQRLSACLPKDHALLCRAVVEAPELHCFLALQEIPKGQGADKLGQTQSQVIKALCERIVGSEAPPVAGCAKALRTILVHYDSTELVSVQSTIKLLHECAENGWWDVARLVVGRLCTHMKSAVLGVVEQKVLGAIRDSLVPFGVCCLAVLLEPLHKIIFLHLSSLMAQGCAPEVGKIPRAIEWYFRLLRKCAGKVAGSESQSAASIIKEADMDFLFWPFVVPSVEMRAAFTPSNQTSFKEARDWSSRHCVKIKIWRDSLIGQLRSDLRMPKATGLRSVDDESCYNWLPFAEYALSSDQWIWLHDLLLHSQGSVEDIEGRHKRFVEISATGAGTLGIGAALVEVLAQERRKCKYHHVPENLQQAPSDSNSRRQDHAAECSGCIHQDSKCTGNAAAFLIWLLRPDSTESCDDTWAIMINNLLLSALTTREGFAFQSYHPSGELLSDRVNPGLSHEDKVLHQAIDSTIITLVQNEKEFILNKWPNGALQLRSQAFKQAERSKWRLEEVVWPALLSQMSCCSYAFTCHRVLEILETFGPRCVDIGDGPSKDNSPFPLLQLHIEQFVGFVKLSPQYFIPLLRFLLAASKVAAVNCFKPDEKKNPFKDYTAVRLDLGVLQEEEFNAGIYHCVSQEFEVWAQQLDVHLLRVAAFSGGSFRYLVGECERSVEPSKSNVMQKSVTQSNSRIFRELSAREKGDSDTSGLVTAIEGRRLLTWKLRTWTKIFQAAPNVKQHPPELEALNKLYIWGSALRTKFPTVDTWVGVGLSALGRALRVQEEDKLWKLEVSNDEADKGTRSAKRPRFSSYTASVLPTMSLEAEREDHEWILEALCRSSVSLEKHLMLYLGLNDTKRGRPKKSQEPTDSKQKTPSGAVCWYRQNVVSYLAKHPSQIPCLSFLNPNTNVFQVACEAIEEAARNISLTNGSDIFELWFQFLENIREVEGNVQSLLCLRKGTLLAQMTECALRHPTRICNWPQELVENLVPISPGLVRRICEEVRGYIESRLAAHATGFTDVETNILSGMVAAMDLNPKVVAKYLESTLVAIYSNVQKASRSPKSISSLVDLLSIGFALCKPESRDIVLFHLQESDLYKSNLKAFDAMPLQAPAVDACVRRAEILEDERQQQEDKSMLLEPAFVLAVVFWRSKILKDLKNTYARRGALNTTHQIAGAIEMDQNLSLLVLRAAICHVLITSEPQLGSSLPECDQRAQAYVQKSSVPGEEMVFQLQACALLEENPSLSHAIISWILLCCRMNVRLNLDHIGALCRLHPRIIRDALIKRIEEELMEASRVGGKLLGWKSTLEDLKEGLLQGLLTWLPLEARSHLTTTVRVPSGFWLGSNIKGVKEIISCLSSTDVGVRRSAYYLVIIHQHHHDFVSILTLELCNEVVSSELNREQEALLGVLMPVLLSEPHTASMAVDSVVMLFRKAKELALSPGSGGEGKIVTSSSEPKQQHVKALLRVGLLACEVSPYSFATEEIALLLVTLAMVEDPSEEIVLGAIQCLEMLALDLQVTNKNAKLVQDLLLHLVYKPAGDYVWHLAMTFADRFTANVAHKDESNLEVKENSAIESSISIKELLFRCPLQRSISLQTILKRLDCLDYHHI